MTELEAGTKRSRTGCGSSFRSSGPSAAPTALFYGLESVDEAKTYLAQPVLGDRLGACTRAVLGHRDQFAHAIFGSPDDLKFRSCMTLFGLAAPEESLFREALEQFCEGRPDPLTVAACGGRSPARTVC